MRKEIHKSDRGFFKGEKKEKGKAKSWSLIYRMGGTSETIMAEKDYPLCNWKKQECAKLSQYKKEGLKIEPNY